MPAMVINTNIPSLNGQRNLYRSNRALNKSLERLSSGLRINRAGDDAAGLAISEGLRSQVRGLNQAVRNTNDGISLVQTAEGTIETYTQICQRVRELAIQAASDVNSDDNRASIQLEIEEQLKELDRIASTMDFNGQVLFDGTFENKRIQVGAKANQTLLMSVGDLRTHVVGGVAQTTGQRVDGNRLDDGSIVINGVDIPASASEAARDKANAINEAYYDTRVFARVEAAQNVGTAAVAAGTLDLTDSITINGVRVPKSGSLSVAANDSTGELRRAINSVSVDTGVQATLNSSNQLVLTATDDSDFDVNVATAAADAVLQTGLAPATDVDIRGRVRLYSDNAFDVADGTGSASDLIGIAADSYALDSNSVIQTLDVTSFEKAQETILKIDNALRQINDVRAGLGALTNRLENTTDNLMIVSENLSASDSRIRDADFAAETAHMTRAQILQQSGVSVLAQANLTPQAALNLLQG
ncbi:MAG: flagellin [Candidatus Sumerlaeia bacterium]